MRGVEDLGRATQKNTVDARGGMARLKGHGKRALLVVSELVECSANAR
jgi:hypothetical protein